MRCPPVKTSKACLEQVETRCEKGNETLLSVPSGMVQSGLGIGRCPFQEVTGSRMISASASSIWSDPGAGTSFVSILLLFSALLTLFTFSCHSRFIFTHFLCLSNCLPLPLMLHFPHRFTSSFRLTLFPIQPCSAPHPLFPALDLNHLLTDFLNRLTALSQALSVALSYIWMKGERKNILRF